MHALMASFLVFCTVFKTNMESTTDVFAQKKFSKDFLISKFVIDTYDRVVQFRE